MISFRWRGAPLALERRHQAFIRTYHMTAHQRLLKERRLPPIPAEVLGEAKGRVCTPEELAHAFAPAVFPARPTGTTV